MIEIKRWDNGEVIHSGDFASVKECLEDGVAKGVCFDYAQLNNAELNDAKLNDAKLNDAKLNDAELNNAELNDAELNYAELNYAQLNNAELNNAKLNRAELNDAELNCDMDYSAWPLWCGSTKAKVSDKIAMQLAYHAICVLSEDQKKRFLEDPIAFANGFHRVGELPKIEEVK